MNDIGYYYSEEIKTIIIGFTDNNGRLNGKVIGNTFNNQMSAPFSFGYKYNRWNE